MPKVSDCPDFPHTSSSGTYVRSRLWAAMGLLLLGIWILHGFLVPLAWAVVLGLATWPLLEQIRQRLPLHKGSALPAVILIFLITIVVFGPMTYGLLQLGHETQSFVTLLQLASQNGLPPPDWLGRIPGIGESAMATWTKWLGTSESVRDSIHYILSSDILLYTRKFAAQLLHRYAAAFFTLVVLFFVYFHGEGVGRQFLSLSERFFGYDGRRYARHAAKAVTATVNGIVLVALGQGVALGFGYAAAGLQHAALLGVLTGIVAFIPFAAKLMFVGASLVLFAEGHVGAGVGLIVYGLFIIITADNYLRPKLIGDAVRLPFIWTLLGILGGIETFGLLGLFLGPTIMAILISVWRDCFVDAEDADGDPHAG